RYKRPPAVRRGSYRPSEPARPWRLAEPRFAPAAIPPRPRWLRETRGQLIHSARSSVAPFRSAIEARHPATARSAPSEQSELSERSTQTLQSNRTAPVGFFIKRREETGGRAGIAPQ